MIAAKVPSDKFRPANTDDLRARKRGFEEITGHVLEADFLGIWLGTWGLSDS